MLDEFNVIHANSAVLFFAEKDKRYYENTNAGRAQLFNDCAIQNRIDLHEQVLSVWGDAPTLPDPPSFEDTREKKIAKLHASFCERVSGAFTTSQGYLMQFDTTDAIKMQGAIQLLDASGATEGYLTQANDETVYNVPINVMKAVLIEMMTAFAACHARKQELRAAIKAAETVEDLGAIEITWPL